MFRSSALLQRKTRFPFILQFAVFFAVVWGAGTGSLLADHGAAAPGGSAATPSLGAASSFVVLGGPAVTCTTSTVTGDVGAGFPGAPVTRTLCSVLGAVHAGDAAAAQAYNDFLLAYLALGATPCPADPAHNLAGSLSGVTLGPGVYCFGSAAVLTGVLTLDAQGDPNAVWTFKVGSPLAGGALTGTNFSVVMAGGGQSCNVYWWVAEAATLTASSFQGSILAGAGITFTGPGSLTGRALAKAAVTLTDMNPFGSCTAAASGPPACDSRDRMEGEGDMKLSSGADCHFDASGDTKHGAISGHLEYTDHGPNGPRVKGTGVTKYLVVDAVTRHIEGTARVNGLTGVTYQVDMSDDGEHGRNCKFAIRLFNRSGALVYSASGNPGCGNMHLHKAHDGPCDDEDGDDQHHDDDSESGGKGH